MDKKRGERPRSEGGRRGGRWKRNEEAEAVVENISRILLFLRASSVTMHYYIDRRRRYAGVFVLCCRIFQLNIPPLWLYLSERKRIKFSPAFSLSLNLVSQSMKFCFPLLEFHFILFLLLLLRGGDRGGGLLLLQHLHVSSRGGTAAICARTAS